MSLRIHHSAIVLTQSDCPVGVVYNPRQKAPRRDGASFVFDGGDRMRNLTFIIAVYNDDCPVW